MKRIALESVVGSTSIITKNRYGWSIKNVGTLHLVNGIIVIPVSIFSGYLSTMYEDRYMSIWFLAITLVGMFCLFDITDLMDNDESETYNEGQLMAVGPARYIVGSLIAFSGIEACESYVASLMSKVVPSALAQGTFNSGLLATLVGTVSSCFALETQERIILHEDSCYPFLSISGRASDGRPFHHSDGVDLYSQFAEPFDHSRGYTGGHKHLGNCIELRSSCCLVDGPISPVKESSCL